MVDTSVVRFRPSRTAAPFSPPMTQFESSERAKDVVRARRPPALWPGPCSAAAGLEIGQRYPSASVPGDDDRPLDHVLQLAHVGRASATGRGPPSSRADGVDPPVGGVSRSAARSTGQAADVLPALPERRNPERKDVEAVVKVGRGTRGWQPSPRGCGWSMRQAEIDAECPRAPQSFELVLLQRP